MEIFEIFKVCDRPAIRASVTQTGKCSKNRSTGRELPLESVRRRVGLAPKGPSNDQQPIEQHRIQNLRRSL